VEVATRDEAETIEHQEIRGSLSVPTTAASVLVVRQLVRTLAARTGATAEWIDELVLAVNEAFSNAVLHGTGSVQDNIEVTAHGDAEGIFVELRYRGEPFNIQGRELPDDVFQNSGRGRYLMRCLLDGEQYLFNHGITILRMFKHY
jgi:anti-sigma regulatory factor (Ser/Thr protein kinase)